MVLLIKNNNSTYYIIFSNFSLFAYRSIYDNRIPKSSKLVFLLEEKLYKY